MSNVVPIFKKKQAFMFNTDAGEIVVPFDDVDSYVCDKEQDKIPVECLRLIVAEWFLERTK
jgi:nitrous oxide reductase accessory protein NosL